MDRHRGPGPIDRRVIVEHRLRGLAEDGLAPRVEHVAQRQVRVPEQPGIEIDREAVLDGVCIDVRAALGRERNLGNQRNVPQLPARLDRVVDHAQKRDEAAVPGINVVFVGIISDRQTGCLPGEHRPHRVFIAAAIRCHTGGCCAAVTCIFNELAVADRHLGVAVALVGDRMNFRSESPSACRSAGCRTRTTRWRRHLGTWGQRQ